MKKESNEENNEKDYVVIGEKIVPPQGKRRHSIIMQAVLPKNMDWEYFYNYIDDVRKMIKKLNNNNKNEN